MSNELPKILIIADAGWGKDQTGIFMEDYGFKYMASSTFATDRIMMPYFESIGKPYASSEYCFEDRINHRSTWYDQIEAYNDPTWNRVTREMFADGIDVYVGMRSPKEFHASRELYDYVIWVDASKRLPREDISSNGMSPDMADYIIDNNGTLEELKHHVSVLTNLLILNKQLNGPIDRHTDVLIAQLLVGRNSDFNLDIRNLRNGKSPCPKFTMSLDAIYQWLVPDDCLLTTSSNGLSIVGDVLDSSKMGSWVNAKHDSPTISALLSINKYYLAKYKRPI